MKRSRVLLTALLLLTLSSAIAVCYASSTYSILYTKFNDETWKNYQLDKQYTSLNVDIKSFITFNETTGDPACKVAITNDTGDTPEGLNFLFKRDSNALQIWKIEGVTEVMIASGTYTDEETVRVTLSSGYVTVKTYNGTAYTTVLQNFAFSNYIEYVRVKGSGSDIATDGYMQVEVNAGSAGINSSITEILPAIVSLAMLGVAIGIVKKTGR